MTNIKLINKRRKHKIEPNLVLIAVTIIALVVILVCTYQKSSLNSFQTNNIKYTKQVKLNQTAYTAPKQEDPKNEIPIYKIPLSEELQRYTYDLCQQYELSYELVLAVMYQESRMNPAATSSNANGTKDKGLMQINSRYLKSWLESYHLKEFNVYNPKDNIKLGVMILSDRVAYWQNRHYSDELLFHAALSSYNRGIGGYSTYIKKYGYETTYSNKILKYKEELEISSTFSDFSIDK